LHKTGQRVSAHRSALRPLCLFVPRTAPLRACTGLAVKRSLSEAAATRTFPLHTLQSASGSLSEATATRASPAPYAAICKWKPLRGIGNEGIAAPYAAICKLNPLRGIGDRSVSAPYVVISGKFGSPWLLLRSYVKQQSPFFAHILTNGRRIVPSRNFLVSSRDLSSTKR